jgi:hypothetical protein
MFAAASRHKVSVGRRLLLKARRACHLGNAEMQSSGKATAASFDPGCGKFWWCALVGGVFKPAQGLTCATLDKTAKGTTRVREEQEARHKTQALYKAAGQYSGKNTGLCVHADGHLKRSNNYFNPNPVRFSTPRQIRFGTYCIGTRQRTTPASYYVVGAKECGSQAIGSCVL